MLILLLRLRELVARGPNAAPVVFQVLEKFPTRSWPTPPLQQTLQIQAFEHFLIEITAQSHMVWSTDSVEYIFVIHTIIKVAHPRYYLCVTELKKYGLFTYSGYPLMSSITTACLL